MGSFMKDNAGKADEEVDRPDRHYGSPETIQRVREYDDTDPGNYYKNKSDGIHDPFRVKEDGTRFFRSFIWRVLLLIEFIRSSFIAPDMFEL
jgi:hypothetical protein